MKTTSNVPPTTADILAKAQQIFGGADEARDWLENAALGLDGQRPIDLMRTPRGAALVDDFLARLEYGVYS